MNRDTNNKDNLNETYTEFSSKDNQSLGGQSQPSGRFGKWIAKFFAVRQGKPTHMPDQTLRGDTYKAEEIYDTKEGGAPSVLRGMIRMPKYEEDRKKRYKEYEAMDVFPEINAAIDVRRLS